jgi:hypothetical protein
MIQLTQQQFEAVDASGEQPPIVIDPRNQTAYVLVRKDFFEQLTGEIDEQRQLNVMAADIDWERARLALQPSAEWFEGDEPKPF